MHFSPPLKPMFKQLLLILLIMGLTACERHSAPEPSGKVFKIIYAHFIGNEDNPERDDVLEGILAANAAEPYLDNGDRLEIIHASKTVPAELARERLKQYDKQHEASAILLGSGSGVVLDIKEEIEKLALPTLAVIATHPDVTSDSRFISQLGFDDEHQGQAAALFVRDELLINRVAVLFDGKDPHSGFLAQEFRTEFEKTGGRIDGFYLVSDLSPHMLKGLRDKETPFVYMPLSAGKVLDAMAHFQAVHWDPMRMGADGLLADLKREYPNRIIETSGMYVTDLYTDTSETFDIARFVKRVARQFKKTFNYDANTKTALGVEGYRSIRDAINQCPSRTNRDCINRALRSGKKQQGIISSYTIQANGKTKRPVFINTIENGKLKLVVKVN